MLKSFLFDVKDHRRAQGQRYELGYVLLFSIFALLSGADSYRGLATFMKVHFEVLKARFGLKWKRSPAYTTIRDIIQGVDNESIETAFRNFTTSLEESAPLGQVIAVDGKTLRGSFDRFKDQGAIQLLSLFLAESQLILAHQEIDEKTNEIPTAQALIEELGLTGQVFTFDALHCQKNA